jgi:hypothetical protein
VDRGRYVVQLQRLAGFYPRDAIHVALFDDLQNHPSQLYRGVCEFLKIKDDIVPSGLDKPINPFVSFRSVKLREWTRTLPFWVRNPIGRFNAQENSYTPMNPEVRRRLSDEFQNDNAALQTWLCKDLSSWKADGLPET